MARLNTEGMWGRSDSTSPKRREVGISASPTGKNLKLFS